MPVDPTGYTVAQLTSSIPEVLEVRLPVLQLLVALAEASLGLITLLFLLTPQRLLGLDGTCRGGRAEVSQCNVTKTSVAKGEHPAADSQQLLAVCESILSPQRGCSQVVRCTSRLSKLPGMVCFLDRQQPLLAISSNTDLQVPSWPLAAA